MTKLQDHTKTLDTCTVETLQQADDKTLQRFINATGNWLDLARHEDARRQKAVRELAEIEGKKR